MPVQGIEGMEKFFLGGFLSGDELDIVDQQDVDPAIFFTKRIRGTRTDRINQIVGEILGGDIQHHEPVFQAQVAHGMQQMGFSQSHASVEK